MGYIIKNRQDDKISNIIFLRNNHVNGIGVWEGKVLLFF